MKPLNYDGKLKIRRKDYKVNKLIDSLMNLPSIDVKAFFEKIGLTIPKSLRMQVLREVLKEPVEKHSS